MIIIEKNPNNPENYKKFNSILRRIVNKAKESFDKELIQAKMNNPKSLWKLNQKLGKNSKRNKNINYIIDNSKQITDSTNMAELMNKFFCEIGKKIADKIVTPRKEKIKLPPMNRYRIIESNRFLQ